MKTFLKILLIGLMGIFGQSAFKAYANLEVGATVQVNAKADFYAPLTPRGSWVEVGSYGRCWRPSGVTVEWRPYSSGYWVWTDCGWYWYSDESWAWACYHYGYWVYDPDYYWVWVPDVVWGPAWVSWRVGGGYVGWAPLPPPGFSVHIAAPSPFIFVEVAHFSEPIRPTKIIVNNTTIINQTKVINNIKQVNRTFEGSVSQKVVVNEGPGIAPIEKATSKKIDLVPIREAAQRTPVPSLPQRKLAPTDRLAPNETPAPIETKPTAPNMDGHAPVKEIAPVPFGPPSRGTFPGNPGGHPGGRGRGPGMEKDKDKDKP